MSPRLGSLCAIVNPVLEPDLREKNAEKSKTGKTTLPSRLVLHPVRSEYSTRGVLYVLGPEVRRKFLSACDGIPEAITNFLRQLGRRVRYPKAQRLTPDNPFRARSTRDWCVGLPFPLAELQLLLSLLNRRKLIIVNTYKSPFYHVACHNDERAVEGTRCDSSPDKCEEPSERQPSRNLVDCICCCEYRAYLPNRTLNWWAGT